MSAFEYDAFISHASEDKEVFVEPLANLLRARGLDVWFDKFSLRVGDSLHDSIEKGLVQSRFGIVVFSQSFLSKRWPRAELNGLFAREMRGQKIILPVWHDITAEQLLTELPIHADKVALKSSDGLEHVASKLIEVIRPDLFMIDVRREVALNADVSLIEVAKVQNPGYSFAVHVGDDLSHSKNGVGVIASISHKGQRIDVSIEDQSRIVESPRMKLEFTGNGAQKAEELIRTGKAQTWQPGEFHAQALNIPFFPGAFPPTSVFTVEPKVGHFPKKRVRILIDTKPRKLLPVMHMRLLRAGQEEAECAVDKKGFPFSLNFTFSPKVSIGNSFSVQWDFSNMPCSECVTAIEVIDALNAGCRAEVFDIDNDETAFELPALANALTGKLPNETVRSIVMLGQQIEDKFRIEIPYPEAISSADEENLHYLDCLLNGNKHGTNLRAEFSMTKSSGEEAAALRAFIAGDKVRLFLEPSNYPGYFLVFGKQIPAPRWGIVTEECICERSDITLSEFDAAEKGRKFKVNVRGVSSTYARWTKDLDKVTLKAT